jgi:hypothetical protein
VRRTLRPRNELGSMATAGRMGRNKNVKSRNGTYIWMWHEDDCGGGLETNFSLPLTTTCPYSTHTHTHTHTHTQLVCVCQIPTKYNLPSPNESFS